MSYFTLVYGGKCAQWWLQSTSSDVWLFSLVALFLLRSTWLLTLCICTYLLWIPQVKEVQETLVTHLLVCGEHDDVAAEVEAARSDSRVGVEQSQLFTCGQHTVGFMTL